LVQQMLDDLGFARSVKIEHVATHSQVRVQLWDVRAKRSLVL